MFDKHDFEAEEEVKVIMRIKIIFHITRMDDVSDVLKKAEELKKEIEGSMIAGQFVNLANPEAH